MHAIHNVMLLAEECGLSEVLYSATYYDEITVVMVHAKPVCMLIGFFDS